MNTKAITLIEILIILVPLLGLMAWVYNRIEKKADERHEILEKRFDKIDQRFEKIDRRFDQVDQRLQSLDIRLTRLEGRFDERGYWEAREFRKKTGTDWE